MAKRKKRNNDIRRRLSDAPYSVDYFAHKHDISPEQARESHAEGWPRPRQA